MQKNNLYPQNGLFVDENGEVHSLIKLLKTLGANRSSSLNREMEFRSTDTHIEWKYTDQTEWKSLVALNQIR